MSRSLRTYLPTICAVLLWTCAPTTVEPSAAQPSSQSEEATPSESEATPSAIEPTGPSVAPEPEPPPEPPPCSHVPGICRIAVQPLGDVPEEQVEAVCEALTEMYGVETVVLEAVELPESAYYEPRRRWRAERLLDFLEPRLPEGCDRILGMTTRDISTTKGEHEDWGILGQARIDAPPSVISFFRCRRRVGDVPAIERLRRVAIHEVGHSMGLFPCPTYGCYLEDAQGTVDTIDREEFLCPICRERLGWRE